MRDGENSLVVQVHNQTGIREDSQNITYTVNKRLHQKPTLHAIVVGVENYGRTQIKNADGSFQQFGQLDYAVDDADSIYKMLLAQKNSSIYSNVNAKIFRNKSRNSTKCH